MLKSKVFIIFNLVFLLLAGPVSAFRQDYSPLDPNRVYQDYFNLIDIEPSWSNDIQVNKEITVAVLDSGIDLDHPDLIDNLWINLGEIANDGFDNDGNSYIDDLYGWDFVDSDNNPEPDFKTGYDFTAVNHGTVVAGIIAAAANNSGIVGIAPQAKIMPLKILNHQGVGNTLVLSQAIDYAVENGADIINLSLVGQSYNDTLKKSIINAYNHGVIIVAASGNENNQGVSLDIDPHYPVCEIDAVNRVVGVAAVDQEKKLASFSNYGEACIDISAPGANFYSTVYHDPSHAGFSNYYSSGWSGTSVSVPIVSATIALIKMNYPDLLPHDINSILSASAQDLSVENPLHYIDLGAGLIDIGAALNLAEEYYNQNIKLVVAPEAGQIPEVSILDSAGNFESSFLAYDQKFTGGVNLAVGDVNNDGQLEIITAPMASGGPHIRVFDDQGRVLFQFFAYEANFHGGVNLAVGDVNNDGKDEIVTAPFSSYVPEIKVFDDHHLIKGNFLAFESSMTAGVKISVGDVNDDGWPEIVAIPAKNAEPKIKLFSLKGTLKGEFLAYNQNLSGGVKVLARDISGDRRPEVLVLPNKGSASLLRIYDWNGTEKDNFYLRPPEDKNGYNFEVLFK